MSALVVGAFSRCSNMLDFTYMSKRWVFESAAFYLYEQEELSFFDRIVIGFFWVFVDLLYLTCCIWARGRVREKRL
jgi:hypothetical protein